MKFETKGKEPKETNQSLHIRLDFLEVTLVEAVRAILMEDPMAIAKLASRIAVLEASHSLPQSNLQDVSRETWPDSEPDGE